MHNNFLDYTQALLIFHTNCFDSYVEHHLIYSLETMSTRVEKKWPLKIGSFWSRRFVSKESLGLSGCNPVKSSLIGAVTSMNNLI